jgi:hypothetical protein
MGGLRTAGRGWSYFPVQLLDRPRIADATFFCVKNIWIRTAAILPQAKAACLGLIACRALGLVGVSPHGALFPTERHPVCSIMRQISL